MVSVKWCEFAKAVLLAGRSGGDADTEQEGLLDDENQHGGNEKRGKTILGVVEAHFLIGDGVLRHEVLLLSGVASACHFYAGIHGERHVGVCRENAFVIEHAAHVAVDAHFHLFAFRQAFGEISRDAYDAVSFAVFYAALGFGHVCTIVDDFNVGRRVNVAQVFAAHCRMAFVDHGNGHFPHHFISIDETIEQRIGQRNEKEEDQDTFVFHDVFQF